MLSITLEIPLDLVLAIASEATGRGAGFEEIVVARLRSSYGSQQLVEPSTEGGEIEGALQRCEVLEAGTLFTLNADFSSSKRLFSRDEWKALSAKPAFRPTVFGRLFGKAVVERGLASPAEKTPDNKQVYRRS